MVYLTPPTVAGIFGGAFGSVTSIRWLVVLAVALVFVVAFGRRAGNSWLSFLRELAIVVPAYFVYFLVRGLVEGRAPEAFQRAARLIHLEQTLNIFWEPTLQEAVIGSQFALNLMNWIYIWGHWPFIVLVALWLFFLHRDKYITYRNAFLISGGIGLIIFATLPVAPPRFMDGWGFVDTVSLHSQAYRVLQPPAFVNQYAAMPSLHFGWNLLVGIAIFRHAPNLPLRLIGLVSPIAVLLAIVLTGNHYFLDAMAGGVIALAGLALAIALRRRLSGSKQPVTAFA